MPGNNMSPSSFRLDTPHTLWTELPFCSGIKRKFSNDDDFAHFSSASSSSHHITFGHFHHSGASSGKRLCRGGGEGAAQQSEEMDEGAGCDSMDFDATDGLSQINSMSSSTSTVPNVYPSTLYSHMVAGSARFLQVSPVDHININPTQQSTVPSAYPHVGFRRVNGDDDRQKEPFMFNQEHCRWFLP